MKMRGYLVALSVVAMGFVCGPDAAQAQAPLPGVGPYEFGASIETVRATAAANWVQEPSQGGASGFSRLSRGPPLVLADVSFDVSLDFLAGELTNLRLSNSTATASFETCARHYEGMLSAFSQRVGPIASEQPPPAMLYRNAGPPDASGRPTDYAVQPRASRHHDGSIIWQYERPGVGLIDYRSQVQRNGITVSLLAHWDGGDCFLSASVADTHRQQSISERIRLNATIPVPPAPSAETIARVHSAPEIDVAQVRFARTPTAEELRTAYPPRALQRGRTGGARLMCIVEQDSTLTCVIDAEEPTGWDFGGGALLAAENYRVAGPPSHVGKRFALSVQFSLPDSD